MIEQEHMIKSMITLSPAWVGTGVTLATLGTWVGIMAGIVTIGYTAYKWRMDVLDRRDRINKA